MLYRDGILMRMAGIKYEMYQLRLKIRNLEDCHKELPDDVEGEILKTIEAMDSVKRKLLEFCSQSKEHIF